MEERVENIVCGERQYSGGIKKDAEDAGRKKTWKFTIRDHSLQKNF